MILVVGAKGMLGRDLMEVLGEEARGVDVEEIDITSFDSTRKVLYTLRPKVVINCAAYTDVDGCETNRELAMQVNGEGVAHLAMICAELGAKLVQISTDYVFDGNKKEPYLEDDGQYPLSVYGESKYAGELNAAVARDYLIVRTQWLYGLKGKNFVETMLTLAADRQELSVVDDQIGSPTWTVGLCQAIKALLDKDCKGIYHVVNSGSCSWNEFARAIFEEAGLDILVKPMTTAELNRPARRPLYSVLDCGKLERDAGLRLPPWRESLQAYLAQRNDRT